MTFKYFYVLTAIIIPLTSRIIPSSCMTISQMQDHHQSREQFDDGIEEKVLMKPNEEATSTYWLLRILLVADQTMTDHYFDDNLNLYLDTLFNQVNSIFRHSSIGQLIHLEVIHTIEINEEQDGENSEDVLRVVSSAEETLKTFCKWKNQLQIIEQFDLAILVTRTDICRNREVAESEACSTMGLAELGSICHWNSSCVIVQDNGLTAAHTLAHEIGHALGIPHDEVDDERCNYDNFVMAPLLPRGGKNIRHKLFFQLYQAVL